MASTKGTKKATKKPSGIMEATINCKALYIRSAPVDNASIVGMLTPDSSFVVDIESSEENWYFVCTKNCVIGYCKKEFITFKQ